MSHTRQSSIEKLVQDLQRDPGRRDLERRLRDVYEYCPPTLTRYRSPGARAEYQQFWGGFLNSLGVNPERFAGARVLDVGCGSCEKASFYHDWGASVTGIDLTPEVLKRGRETLDGRNIELINASIFDFERQDAYDLAFIDGVSFITADTVGALGAVVRQLRAGGVLVFSTTNIWGRLWWFALARRIVQAAAGDDFHKRARWGSRLFGWTRRSQEGTEEDAAFYRSRESWAYDWFGPPVYRLHAPDEICGWLATLGLQHLGSVPSIVSKDPPLTNAARLLRALTGASTRALRLYWLANRAPNMAYVAAEKRSDFV